MAPTRSQGRRDGKRTAVVEGPAEHGWSCQSSRCSTTARSYALPFPGSSLFNVFPLNQLPHSRVQLCERIEFRTERSRNDKARRVDPRSAHPMEATAVALDQDLFGHVLPRSAQRERLPAGAQDITGAGRVERLVRSSIPRIGGSSCLLASQPSDPGADAPPCVPSMSC